MRLIGIKINQAKTEDHIKRCLKDEWYPFGDFEDVSKVKDYDKYVEKLKNRNSNGLYFITGEGGKKIDVNISCIVGKNGSGKTTVIDLMMSLINNFTCSHLNDISIRYGCTHTYIPGVHASLFYELYDSLYEIRDDVSSTNLYSLSGIDKQVNVINNISDVMIKLHLAFFYTIILDYSLYSHNTNEYKIGNQNDEEVWLHSLFHKNDAYVTPIVLNPFRDEGNIDVNKENRLACQRLSAIVFQLASRNIHEFLPNYKDINLVYVRNNRYTDVPQQITKWDSHHKYDEKTKQWLPYNNSPNLILFQYIKKGKVDTMGIKGELKEELCNYIAYKIMKICKNYADFSDLFKIQECLTELSNAADESDRSNIFYKYDNSIDKVIQEIDNEHSHITYKYHQAKNFYVNRYFKDDCENKVDINELAKKSRNQNYWQTFEVLPPPIFDIDVEFLQMNDSPKNKIVRFKTMSSGERQFLFSFSSVIYHIMNISSIVYTCNRIDYHNINIVLDEVELYSHPEYQKNYVKNILNSLSSIHISDKISSINILVVTHSPFILSDICKENTLYLENGRRKETELTDSFGANYYDLLLNGFFLQEGGAVGAWAAEVFKSIVASKESTNTLQLEDDQKIKFAELFGDPLVSGVLKRRIIEIENKNKKKKS